VLFDASRSHRSSHGTYTALLLSPEDSVSRRCAGPAPVDAHEKTAFVVDEDDPGFVLPGSKPPCKTPPV
jgi:hypothetical protein